MYESEILPGLKSIAQGELARRFRKSAAILPCSADDAIVYNYAGRVADLFSLRTHVAVYRTLLFDIPRPRALLGHQHLTRLLDAVAEVRHLHAPDAFRTFRFSAAGRDSAVFGRLRDEIGVSSGLEHSEDEADLLLRVRPARAGLGWEVLVRLTPRPLSVRQWRVCDMPGALNATIAGAMIALTSPQASDRFMNLMCGSATLLVERAQWGASSCLAGCDLDLAALDCARANLSAAGLWGKVDMAQADARATGYPASAFDVLAADLPWGQLSGEQAELADLYPAVLHEAARLAIPGARAVFLTHRVTLFESILKNQADAWSVQDVVKIYQGGLHPRIYVLIRR